MATSLSTQGSSPVVASNAIGTTGFKQKAWLLAGNEEVKLPPTTPVLAPVDFSTLSMQRFVRLSGIPNVVECTVPTTVEVVTASVLEFRIPERLIRFTSLSK
jgi:hypothetical protein